MKHVKFGHHIPVPSYYQLNSKKRFLMFAQGVGGAKTEVIKVGGVTLMHFFLGACRLSHLIFVKMNLFPSDIRDLWYAIHTR